LKGRGFSRAGKLIYLFAALAARGSAFMEYASLSKALYKAFAAPVGVAVRVSQNLN
jgi:hypothetical protein